MSNIVGNRIMLRPIKHTDHEQIVIWRNTPIIHQCFFSDNIITMDSHLSWFYQAEKDPTQKLWMIEHLINKIPIGMTSLLNIDWNNKNTEHGRIIIDLKYRSGGFAKEAMFLEFQYAFEELKLNRVWCAVLMNNLASLNFHVKVGFKQEGVLKEHVYKDGHFHDIARFGLLAKDFKIDELNLRKICMMGQPNE